MTVNPEKWATRPTHIFNPPFNIIRCSHTVLDVVDLNKSRAFYGVRRRPAC